MAKVAHIKTQETEENVMDFINSLTDENKIKDSLVILKMMESASKEKPKMWGKSLVGFCKKRYKSPATGREVDWFKIGFSPRKNNLSLHLVLDIKKYAKHLEKLGKHKTGAGCLYINKLSDVDTKILKELIAIGLKGK